MAFALRISGIIPTHMVAPVVILPYRSMSNTLNIVEKKFREVSHNNLYQNPIWIYRYIYWRFEFIKKISSWRCIKQLQRFKYVWKFVNILFSHKYLFYSLHSCITEQLVYIFNIENGYQVVKFCNAKNPSCVSWLWISTQEQWPTSRFMLLVRIARGTHNRGGNRDFALDHSADATIIFWFEEANSVST